MILSELDSKDVKIGLRVLSNITQVYGTVKAVITSIPDEVSYHIVWDNGNESLIYDYWCVNVRTLI